MSYRLKVCLIAINEWTDMLREATFSDCGFQFWTVVSIMARNFANLEFTCQDQEPLSSLSLDIIINHHSNFYLISINRIRE